VASPEVSRRHAAGADSARGLLLTVLGELVLPTGGEAWTSTLIDVLGRFGVEDKATRQALMRTAADGWLAAERRGRRTRWTLTGSGEELLVEGTERIFGFRAVTDDWDGRLVFVLARVPESDRAIRHRLRTRLGWAGFGSAAPGLWISTHTERLREVERLLADVPIADARVFVAEHAGGAELSSMVQGAWDLETVESSYQEFLADFASARRSDPLLRLVELVHAWRRFPMVDPALPRELLPARWSGERAAQLFAKRHANWAAEALAEWTALERATS
jgi:phenylacetic acid degradation operon negative regulatory protein